MNLSTKEFNVLIRRGTAVDDMMRKIRVANQEQESSLGNCYIHRVYYSHVKRNIADGSAGDIALYFVIEYMEKNSLQFEIKDMKSSIEKSSFKLEEMERVLGKM